MVHKVTSRHAAIGRIFEQGTENSLLESPLSACGPDTQEISVLNRWPRGRAVVCCSARFPGSPDRRYPRTPLKVALASTLLSALAAENGGGRPQVNSAAPVRIVSNRIGKPELYIGPEKGPAVSFSYAADRIWAALCSGAAGLGIDAASPWEFSEDYPFHRAFQKEELRMALRFCHGNRGEAAAFLWSAKEAFLKALGCGFHLVDPLQVLIYEVVGMQAGVECCARLTDEAWARLPELNGGGLPVSAVKQKGHWVSVAAIFSREPALAQSAPPLTNSRF